MKPNQSQPELTAGILKRVGTVAVFLVIIAAILFLYTKYRGLRLRMTGKRLFIMLILSGLSM